MLKVLNPSTIAPPLLPSYSNGIEVPRSARWVHTAGMVGVDKEGKPGAGLERQAELIWESLLAVLASADMGPTDIVKMNAFVVMGQDAKAYGAIRKRYLGDHKPASTMIYVPALVSPDFLLEVEVIAAKA